jgi:hypothetical protein
VARPTIYYSTDDGDSWDDAADVGKPPTACGDWAGNFVIVDDEFADNGTAWCISEVVNGSTPTEMSVSLTMDGGDIWNGISMIDTDMEDGLLDVALAGTAGAPLFMVTECDDNPTRSVWSYDGTYWERVFLVDDGDHELDLVALSPDYASDEAVFIADSDDPMIFYSHDNGGTFTAMTRNPDDAITAWVVIDHETIITGDEDGNYYKTDRYGRRTWDTDTINLVDNDITDLAVSPNFAADGTMLAGDDDSLVYISTDEGETWEDLSDSDLNMLMVTATGPTYVEFDADYANNGIIYAASDDVIARCEINETADMDEQEFEQFAGGIHDPGIIDPSGMVCSADGVLYVADAHTASGVWRCLNPTDDMGDVDWEAANDGLTTETFCALAWGYESNLEVSVGSNHLWCIDTNTGVDLVTYEDTLVGPMVAILPGDGAFLPDTDRIVFAWEELNADTVVNYQLEVYEEQDWLDESGVLAWTVAGNAPLIPGDPGAIWTGANAGTKYMWRVRVDYDSPVASRWSEIRACTTKVGEAGAPVNVRPEPGAQDIILRPTFDWAPIDGADSYKIEVSENVDFSPLTTSGTSVANVWVCDVELDYGTTYFWRVMGVSPFGASYGDPVVSAFTTMGEPEDAPPPVIVQDPGPAPEIVIPPTPAPITPVWIYVIIGVGAALAIAVIVLIVRTRRVP